MATLHLFPLLPLTPPPHNLSSHSTTVSKHPSLLQLGEKGLELSYTALVFYKQIPETVNVYLKLVVVHNLDPFLEVKFV